MDKQNIHFHTFRHTFATMLFETGISPRVVQLLMGHRDVETALAIYTHVATEMFDAAASKLDGLFMEMSGASSERPA
jgi:site-specific recombinase XerD